jgi:hypothetical protein
MTEMQRKWYRMLLEKDIDAVNGAFLIQREYVADEQVPLVRRRERRDCSISSCNFENVVIILIVSSPFTYCVLKLICLVFDGAVSFDGQLPVTQS